MAQIPRAGIGAVEGTIASPYPVAASAIIVWGELLSNSTRGLMWAAAQVWSKTWRVPKLRLRTTSGSSTSSEMSSTERRPSGCVLGKATSI